MKNAILLFAALSASVFAGEPSPAGKQEIAHLLSYLKDSGCQFSRNGSWYGADEAVDHISQKYDYLLRKGLVGSAEDFIARAASESSISGKPYEVKCGSVAPVQSGPWLRAELSRYRARSAKSR